jgi:predicted pyridoxine 5'-phosphate oxidase superfamily flavin-nucleotide-binding protein
MQRQSQPSKASSTTNGMKIVAQAWDNREGPAVLATADASKTPNAIYVGEIRYVPGEGFIVADNYFRLPDPAAQSPLDRICRETISRKRPLIINGLWWVTPQESSQESAQLESTASGSLYLCKTRANIQNGTKGAVLFLTKERKSFQVKGPLTYHTAGPIFENMRSWHDPKYPGVAAVLLRVEEAYSGAEKLL